VIVPDLLSLKFGGDRHPNPWRSGVGDGSLTRGALTLSASLSYAIGDATMSGIP
jgi:hypothetical protein